jgi:hypothetical protein
MITINLTIRLQSPNVKEHWTQTHKRNKRYSQSVKFLLQTNSEAQNLKQKLKEMSTHQTTNRLEIKAISVSLTRFGRKMDYDNYVYGCKPIRDAICSWFFPQLKPGHADGLDIFTFNYYQHPGKPKLTIEVTHV